MNILYILDSMDIDIWIYRYIYRYIDIDIFKYIDINIDIEIYPSNLFFYPSVYLSNLLIGLYIYTHLHIHKPVFPYAFISP